MNAPAFADSRRLTGPNLFFAECGAVIETAPGIAIDATYEAAWRERIDAAFAALGWPLGPRIVRRHAHGVQLAIAAPMDRLFTATSVNEWALQDALGLAWAPDEDEPSATLNSRDAAFDWLRAHAASERDPALMALLADADRQRLPALVDDESLTLGSGVGGATWPLAALPAPDGVAWDALQAVPTALVTGSNGKTTTARLVSAIAAEAGLHAGHCCTDGLYRDGVRLAAGDYSGPAGARAILRDAQVEFAVLETARGGILRRGLALSRADVAIVTNLSADHFGEYGIDDLEGLADAKLVVARAVESAHGLLVLNADDAVLAARGSDFTVAVGWFALDDDHPLLAMHRAQGGATCGVRDGRIHLSVVARGIDADLGEVVSMPLTLAGHVAYNVANLLGAALVAAALGLSAEAMRTVFARFGRERSDNPGRLERWQIDGVRVILDYAHNPDGLRGLLEAATAEPFARLVLVLGQAGNRGDEEIRELAAIAAGFHPQGVVLKDIAGMERGRGSGEVAMILRDELLRHGIAADAIVFESAEAEAARLALRSARAGDVVVLPIHGSAARVEVEAMLDGFTPSPGGRGNQAAIAQATPPVTTKLAAHTASRLNQLRFRKRRPR